MLKYAPAQLCLCRFRILVAGLLLAPTVTVAQPIAISSQCKVDLGAVNGVMLTNAKQRVVVYGWDEPTSAKALLLTHGRRDVVWKAESVRAESRIAPAKSKDFLNEGPAFWQRFSESRFHDYGQQTTKVPTKQWKIDRWVDEGDTVDVAGLQLNVIETPGFTRDAATYILNSDGKRIGFTGDLLYGDGQTLDLYSFQDAIPTAQIRGYHGYGGRLADLVASLDKVIEAKLDFAVPARGQIIKNPSESAAKLKRRVQAIYHNYLSTNALNWYFKEERMRTCGQRVLGQGAAIELMPYCQHEDTPDWIYENSTSRLILSESGVGFLLDCGSKRVIDAIQGMIKQGVIDKVEGIFVTHYHDDHTDHVQAAAEAFQCPVYATPQYADVLERPMAYHLPAMTANPIKNVKRMKDGSTMKWREFQFTFHFFPGQAYYHGALHVAKPNSEPVFFIGDAFAPSGIDDYCVLNRNLLHDNEGYLLCLNKVRSKGNPWLVNEHIPHVFKYTKKEHEHIRSQYLKRRELLAALFPWDDPNYGVDEQWAVAYPRGIEAEPEQAFTVELRIQNHSPVARKFDVTIQLPQGVSLAGQQSAKQSIHILPGGRFEAPFALRLERDARDWNVVTFDIDSDGMKFRRWADAYIERN